MPDDPGNILRKRISKLLSEGVDTLKEPVPEDDLQFASILGSLQQLEQNDLKSKLVLAGFTNYPHGEEKMRCLECMYYLPHRKWCNLPELALPVQPDWHCRLWRI